MLGAASGRHDHSKQPHTPKADRFGEPPLLSHHTYMAGHTVVAYVGCQRCVAGRRFNPAGVATGSDEPGNFALRRPWARCSIGARAVPSFCCHGTPPWPNQEDRCPS